MAGRFRRTAGAVLVVGALVAAGCGDDDDDDAAGSETTAVDATAADGGATETTAAGATDTTAAGGAVDPEYTEICALAAEMANAEEFPTAEQLTRYQELAPPEVKPAVDALVAKMLPVLSDPVALLAVFADDESEELNQTINDFEEAECGIPHSEENALPPGASREVEPDATRVDVTAVEFDFEHPATIAAGRTSFVVTNEGAQAHFLGVVKLAAGVTIEDALQSDDPTGTIEGEWDTDLAAPGGDDETITFDLTPGDYAMVCFLPDADGTPHAFKGMAVPFTVG